MTALTPASVTGPDGVPFRATELEGLRLLERRLREVSGAHALAMEVSGPFMRVPARPDEQWLTASGLTQAQHQQVTDAAQAERTARGENINFGAAAQVRQGWAAQARALSDAYDTLPDGEDAGRVLLRARLISAAADVAFTARVCWSRAFDEAYPRVRALLWVAADADPAGRGAYAALGQDLEDAKAHLNRERARHLRGA